MLWGATGAKDAHKYVDEICTLNWQIQQLKRSTKITGWKDMSNSEAMFVIMSYDLRG